MSWIEINPDLKRLTVATERIAAALEGIALAAYGINPKPRGAKDPVPAPDDDITYASDEGTLRNELEELVRPGAVQERDGETVTEEVGDVLRQNGRT